jgi:predicted SnoaL-like aldol condensation-catalyzing enzyme
MQQQIVNKSIIRDFYRRALVEGDVAFAERVVADDYLNHSPMAKPGKAGLIEAMQYMKTMPKPPNPPRPFLRLVAEGDYVVTNLSFDWAGKRKNVVDIFRFRDGQLAEHWDAIEDQPDTSLNGRPLMDGPVEIEDLPATAANKNTAAAFFQTVLAAQRPEMLPHFVVPDLVQHNPYIADGLTGLAEYLQRQPDTWLGRLVRLVIAEGNFAVIQSENPQGEKPAMRYDVFRLEEGKIVEQWGVRQMS